jgi:hypothetical protein
MARAQKRLAVKTVSEHIRARLFPDPEPEPEIATLGELQASEWSPEFEQYMRNRLIMGALRYGRLGAPGKPSYDCVSRMQKDLLDYHLTGNREFLVDIANHALVEFVEGRHPKAHFRATDGGKHTEVKNGS